MANKAYAKAPGIAALSADAFVIVYPRRLLQGQPIGRRQLLFVVREGRMALAGLPGTVEFFCPIYGPQAMSGSITVE